MEPLRLNLAIAICYSTIVYCCSRYPGTTFMDHIMRYQAEAEVKIIVVLGEVFIDCVTLSLSPTAL